MSVKVRLEKGRETKNFVRFEALYKYRHMIGYLYISKDLLPTNPSNIEIEIKPVEEVVDEDE